MCDLVIAEKPSVAMSLSKVLGAGNRKDGYMEGGGFLVSWCVGHLVELAPADAYDPKYLKWVYADLPILPEHWQYIVPEDKKKQLSILKELMHRPDVETVICATDAGREGQLIFQLVYNLCGCKKPVKRLWISSMEETAIREGFSHLQPGSDYERLYQAALCRSQADWLVGINATRLFSVLYQRTLNVGRVQTPTLAMIVNRTAAIDRFQSEPFYTVVLDMGYFTASGEKSRDKAAAETVRAACDGADAVIRAIERKERLEKPPALYDLTGLQRDANRLYGFTAQQTLDYTQALYEKKLVTYPRTDSRFLTGDMAADLPALVSSVAGALPFGGSLPFSVNVDQVVDDAKVSDHHAIIPTATMPGADFSGLPAGELAILHLIAARLLAAVGDPYRYLETSVTLTCGGQTFTTKGRQITGEGWKGVDRAFRATLKEKPEKEQAAPLPELSEGQTFPAHASIREGKTSPPKPYTEDTLLAAMECAGAEDMPEDAERKGLGTPATRAGIIEKLVRTEFVERKGKNLLPTQKGLNLITVAPELIASPLLTAEWEEKLKQVEKGELPAADFMAGITDFVSQLVKTYEVLKQDNGSPLFAPEREAVGCCPRCGSPVVEISKGFVCDNRSCGFSLWKENRFFTSKGKKLTKALAVQLLKDGKAPLKGCHSEKTGKDYDAVVVLDDTGGKYVNFKLEFAPAPKGKKGGRKK